MSEFADATVDKRHSPLLDGGSPFKIAVFSPNMAGGTNLTKADGTPVVTWPEQVALAQAAERAGIDAFIPVARWRSPSPSNDPAVHRSFEAFAWAAGISAVTDRMQIFATLHISTMHPVRAAKEIATVDHISGGRFGLNVVAGWNADEFRMFDLTLTEHDDRYQMADAWMSFVEQVFRDPQPFDLVTKWYKAFDVISQPLPVQRGGPVVMSAGFSPAGRAFAAKHADLNFVITPDREAARSAIASTKQRARDEHDRELKMFGAAHILCRDTEREAKAEHQRVVHELGDWAAARNAMQLLVGSSHSAEYADAMAASAIFGFFATPLVGTPTQVVEQLQEMAADGLDGVALSWVDYAEGIEQYEQVLLPLLRRAGMRT